MCLQYRTKLYKIKYGGKLIRVGGLGGGWGADKLSFNGLGSSEYLLMGFKENLNEQSLYL